MSSRKDLEPRHQALLQTLEEVFRRWPQTRLGQAVVNASPACRCPEVFYNSDEDLEQGLKDTYLVEADELGDSPDIP